MNRIRYRMHETVDGTLVEVTSPASSGWYWVATFKATPEAERCFPGAKMADYCEHCERPFESETDICPKCCEHADFDHGICGNCGTDCTDDLVGEAESASEGER